MFALFYMPKIYIFVSFNNNFYQNQQFFTYCHDKLNRFSNLNPP